MYRLLRGLRPPRWAEELVLWAVSGMESFCQQVAASIAPGGQGASEAPELSQRQEHLSSLLRVFVTCHVHWVLLGGGAAESGGCQLESTRLDELARTAQQVQWGLGRAAGSYVCVCGLGMHIEDLATLHELPLPHPYSAC